MLLPVELLGVREKTKGRNVCLTFFLSFFITGHEEMLFSYDKEFPAEASCLEERQDKHLSDRPCCFLK